mmetsp:Transcript_16038/g.25000  ORF Transcript_16038/g.25000 Transcript_16038/m.25000 type:complete len:236 (+) Transcript_16038:493-1200(+)
MYIACKKHHHHAIVQRVCKRKSCHDIKQVGQSNLLVHTVPKLRESIDKVFSNKSGPRVRRGKGEEKQSSERFIVLDRHPMQHVTKHGHGSRVNNVVKLEHNAIILIGCIIVGSNQVRLTVEIKGYEITGLNSLTPLVRCKNGGDLSIHIKTQNTAIQRGKRKESIRTINMLGKKHLIGSTLTIRAGNVHLIHSTHNIDLVPTRKQTIGLVKPLLKNLLNGVRMLYALKCIMCIFA